MSVELNIGAIEIRDGDNMKPIGVIGSGGSLDTSEIQELLDSKTSKTRIDFDGNRTFKIGTKTLNYKELHDVHLAQQDFAFVVYGDRAYLLSYVQDDASSMRELRFQSVIATTDSNGVSNTKTSGIYVKSSDGINIASVTVTDINSENNSYKASAINDTNKNNVWYPSNKAVADYVDSSVAELNDDLLQLKDDVENINPSVEVTVDDDETIVIGRGTGSGSSSGGNTTPSTPTETVTIDTAMSDTSTNPVQNKVIKAYVDSKATGGTSGGSDKYTLVETYTLTPNGDNASCTKELDLEALGKTDYLINIDVSGKTTNATNLRIMDGGSISGASASAKDNPVRGTAQVSFVDGMCFGTACVDSGYGRNFASISGSPRLSATQKKKVVVSFYPFVTETITATIKVYGRG